MGDIYVGSVRRLIADASGPEGTWVQPCLYYCTNLIRPHLFGLCSLLAGLLLAVPTTARRALVSQSSSLTSCCTVVVLRLPIA